MPKRVRATEVPNTLLASLPIAEYELIRQSAEPVTMELKRALHEPGQETRHVYFPFSGVISLLTILDDGSAVEVATVGNEGMVDFAAYFGMESPARWLVQVPGRALRVEARDLRAIAEKSEALLSVIHNYMLAMFVQVSQTAACNRRHAVDQRCARWLLMTHDRVDGDVFPMTHEFLADMLGIRRPSVSIAMSSLHRSGYVSYRRGKVAVLDRDGLEKAACECYNVVGQQFESRFPLSPYLAQRMQ
jgi:CRP-like cAMP-binding protein